MLGGAALGRLQGLFVDEQRRRALHLTVQQADHVGRAGDLAQLPSGLQMALQNGHGQTAGTGAQQVDVLAGANRPTGIDGLLERPYIARQPPLAMAGVRVAPAHHEHLQAVLQRVLDEALARRQIEDVVLVDLRRHDQQRPRVLLLAHRLVLDQLEQLVAVHHRTGGDRQVAADLEGLLAHLAGHAAVVQQVVEQVADALEQTDAAGVEQLLDRQRVEQAVGRRQGIAELGQDEARAGLLVGRQIALVDPGGELPLPDQVGLQTAAIEGIELPGGVLKAGIAAVRWQHRVATQHAPQLPAEGQGMTTTVDRLPDALQGQGAQGGQQVAAAQAAQGALPDMGKGHGFGQGARRWFLSHGKSSSGHSGMGSNGKGCSPGAAG
ncbi:hypothetical protein D3C85_989610 [compost metagenome]